MEEWLSKALASGFSDTTQQALRDAYFVSGGFVFARPTDFDHLIGQDDVFGALRRLGILQGLIEAFQPLGLRRESEGLFVYVENGEQALHLALSLSQFKEAQPLSIAVSAGEVFKSPKMELFGEAIQRMRHLVTFARPHELLVPRDLLEQFSLPQGIGVFSAPEVLEEHLSFECAILRDFRSAVPMNDDG